MRRFVCLLLVGLLMAGFAVAEDPMMQASIAIFDAIQEKTEGKNAAGTEISQTGNWMSAVSEIKGVPFTEWIAVTYDMDAQTVVTWDDLFTDGDAAAARMEEIAREATYDNAYAEHNEIAPMPRDNFAIFDGQLTVYYPPEQLSHFSDRAGAFSFYAYELDGLLREGVSFEAPQAEVASVLTNAGILPGFPGVTVLGTDMASADAALVLVDVPDIKDGAAVWHFEAPCMRGVSLLSAPDDLHVDTATITGVLAERIDLYGLYPGVSGQEACEAVLGAADRVDTVETADAYSLLPVGETLVWTGGGRELALHFVEDVLHSVLLRAV